MARTLKQDLLSNCSTDANFRTWAQFIYDAFVTLGGWVQTSDTGQLTISTATHPAAANTIVGYHIYRMNDALQATAPCFIKVSFASGTGGNTQCALYIVVGTGSDGAGTITGQMFASTTLGQPTLMSNDPNSTANNNYASADTNRITIGMFVDATHAFSNFTWGLERSIDATGAYTDDGFQMLWCSAGGNDFNRSAFLDPSFSLANQPKVETLGVSWIGSGLDPNTSQGYVNPDPSDESPTSTAGDVLAGLPHTFKGQAMYPGYNWAIVRAVLQIAGAQIELSWMSQGIQANYISLSPLHPRNYVGTPHTGDTVYMRWD